MEESVFGGGTQRTARGLETTDVVVGGEVLAIDPGGAIGNRLRGAVHGDGGGHGEELGALKRQNQN